MTENRTRKAAPSVTSEADAYDSAAAAARNVDTRLEAIGAHIDQIVLLLDRQQTTRTGCGTPTIGCDAVVIVNECLGFFRPAADMKRLSLNLAVAPGVQSEIIVDPAALRQVLLNLLSNAVKFTVEGAIEVRLRPMCNGATLRIEVTDTGPGISGERHRLLFQDLERADAPVTNRIMGGGLGLSLAARAAVSIGGQLRHSDNPGGGSIFSLDLPVAPKSCPPTTEVLSNREAGMARPSGPADRVLRIMIVDDTLMHRDLASVVLSEAGHEVRSVTSASEAIKVASQEDLDLVLMDIRMPTMSGLEATRHIRSLKDARGRVPILALTAQSSAEQIEKCRAAGMNGHVAKPFDAPSLLAAVLRAAAVRQRSGGRYPWLGNASAAGP